MLGQTPISFDKVKKEDLEKEILRVGMIAELDAINLYEQLATMSKNENTKRVFLDVAKEEKIHFGEFQTLLLKEDPEQVKEMDAAKKEVKKTTEQK